MSSHSKSCPHDCLGCVQPKYYYDEWNTEGRCVKCGGSIENPISIILCDNCFSSLGTTEIRKLYKFVFRGGVVE